MEKAISPITAQIIEGPFRSLFGCQFLLHLAKKNNKCPNCGSSIKPNDEVCPICKKPIIATEEPFSA